MMSTQIASQDEPAIETRLAEANQAITQTQATLNRIKSHRSRLEAEASVESWGVSSLEFRRWMRGPADSSAIWRIGLLTLCPTASGVMYFIIADLVFASSISSSLIGSGITAACIVMVLGNWINRPSDAELPGALEAAKIKERSAYERLTRQVQSDGCDKVQEDLEQLLMQRERLKLALQKEIESGKRKRAVLLEQNWRAMRDSEWEDFLVTVFHALGAKAERIGCAGDQGCDLIVEIGEMRIAVQAKGYYHAVSNKAVQEAFTGMRHYGCTACAVITNSRFTKNARQVAETTGCVLICEENLADFVTGRIDFFPKLQPSERGSQS